MSSLYTDTYVGRYIFKEGTSSADILLEDQQHTSEGLEIIAISGIDTFYNAIWAEHAVPLARTWTAVGSTSGFIDNAAAEMQVDDLFRTFMMRHGVRYAQVSIGKGGSILMERAYSWTEAGRYQAQPSDKMLLASLSKMFCAAAIQALVDEGKVALNTRPWVDFRHRYPWSYLGRPIGNDWPTDRRFFQVRIQHLLDHQSGLATNNVNDPLHQMSQIALDLGKSTPPNISEFVEWITQKARLDFTPGAGSQYSNIGYIVLSEIIEYVTKMDYFDYLDSAVLGPMGLSGRVKLYPTSLDAHVNDDITQDTQFTGHDVMQPTDPTLLTANVYGGDGIYKETAIGPSSLATSASTLVTFMNLHGMLSPGTE
jgi:CubicO group peptidase (beta-lactamase class C family)